ncbi:MULTISPECIES: PucR family transcriptional regulator [unclassified Pseudarthrobacter]|uniref:PucR family transcriptional regulator n=1 Tax=unclassified Pseudarthrobacter TaxID=2647000 RepID=UPI0030788458
MRLGDLYALHSLGLVRVSGSPATLNRPVKWSHVGEVMAGDPWLTGDEVLLITGRDQHEGFDWDAYVRHLVDSNCTAIGYGVGIHHDEIPEGLIETARRYDFPVFRVPEALPFIAITRAVFDAVYREKYAALRDAISLNRKLLPLVVEQQDPRHILQLIGGALHRPKLALFDYYGRPLAWSGVYEEDARAMWGHVRAHWPARSSISYPENGNHYSVVPIPGKDETVAFLVSITSEEPDERYVLVMEQGLTVLGLVLAQLTSVREERRARVGQLLTAVVEHKLDDEAAAVEFSAMGIREIATHQVLSCRQLAEGTRDPGDLVSNVEDLAVGLGAQQYIGWVEDQLVVLLVDPQPAAAETLWNVLRARGWEATVGRSETRDGLQRLDESVFEARTAALDGRRGVAQGGTLAIDALIGQIATANGVEAFLAQTFGEMTDTERNEAFFETLEVYLRHGGRPGPTAEELHVHRQTLAYRIDRIQQLTGRNLRNGPDMLDLLLALKLRQQLRLPRRSR